MPRVGADNDLRLHRVVEGLGHHVAQRLDEGVRPFRPMDVQHALPGLLRRPVAEYASAVTR
jgi:hypothetical protein